MSALALFSNVIQLAFCCLSCQKGAGKVRLGTKENEAPKQWQLNALDVCSESPYLQFLKGTGAGGKRAAVGSKKYGRRESRKAGYRNREVLTPRSLHKKADPNLS